MIKTKNINELLKFKKTSEGYYEKELNGLLYSVRQNREVKTWHLYVNGEWSNEVETCKHGKLLAIASSMDLV